MQRLFSLCLILLCYVLYIVSKHGISNTVNIHNAVKIASYASCRSLLETFGRDFVKKHSKNDFKTCQKSLTMNSTMSDIFGHFEVCECVTKHDKLLLGDVMSEALKNQKIKLPTSGSFKRIYSSLSDLVHNSSILIDDFGKVIVPVDLDDAEKRFWIRFLYAIGKKVVVLGATGLREPYENEINTPPNSTGKN